MADISRRNLIQASTLLAAPPVLLTLLAGCSPTPNSEADTSQTPTPPQDAEDAKSDRQSEKQSTNGAAMKVHYLEIVSPEADALCAQYATIHGVTFAESDPNLGGARTAVLDNGGMIGIRAPMHGAEKPVVRPYVLVDDIQASVDSAAKAGAEVAVPPMELGGHGTCAIVIRGGIECGFWQI